MQNAPGPHHLDRAALSRITTIDTTVLSHFLIWYLYHDLIYPPRTRAWYCELPALPLFNALGRLVPYTYEHGAETGNLRDGTLADANNPQFRMSPTVSLRRLSESITASCRGLGLLERTVRWRISRFGDPALMVYTEIAALARRDSEHLNYSDLLVTHTPRKKLYLTPRSAIIKMKLAGDLREVVKLRPERDTIWYERKKELIKQIKGYLQLTEGLAFPIGAALIENFRILGNRRHVPLEVYTVQNPAMRRRIIKWLKKREKVPR
ncbi:MAG: hypothetical protein Q9157_000042 [Trypethelium eluteriae]